MLNATILRFPLRPPVESKPVYRTVVCETCGSYFSNEPEATLEHLVRCEAGDVGSLDRAAAVKRIRDALRKRSGKSWSVTGGRGTGWGWLRIDAPPARRRFDGEGKPTDSEFGYMGIADRVLLGQLLGMGGPAGLQGEQVPSGTDFYWEYIARAEGREPTIYGSRNWD